MSKNISVNLQEWMKKCLKKEFGSIVQEGLENDEDYSDIAERIIRSKEMSVLLNSIKSAITEQHTSKSASIILSESRPQSAFSFASDLTIDDWNSPKCSEEQYNMIIDRISCDKPAHVRLAGYEVLLKSELSNLNTGSVWKLLQKTLLDGLTDESRSVFEASLNVHAKLLTGPQSHDVYTNLLNAFNAQYHSRKTFEILPTLISGINFKFFLHEKLFRIVHLIIHHQEEMLKGIRNVDKTTEEIIEQFIIFLSTHEFGNTMQPKTLNILNIISVLEPCANWSKRWMLGLATRKTFIAVLGKSQSLLQHVIEYVKKGLEKPNFSIAASIYDDPMEVCINGNTIEAVTYLHCLCFVSQLCSYKAGRKLLAENSFEIPFTVSNFLTDSLKALNKLSSEMSGSVYDVSNCALQSILDKPKILYDIKFYHVALCYLLSLPESEIKIWPHTLDIISHMLDTTDGSLFLTSECKEHAMDSEIKTPNCAACSIVIVASNVLRQPFSIMNTEYLIKLFKVMEKLFEMYDAYEVVQDKVEKEFYPAVSYFYNKLDNCYFENEGKTQQINSALKKLLLKIVSIPFGVWALVQEAAVFEELLRESIAPLRMSWGTPEVVNFVTFAAFFQFGYNILTDLAPHVLSTLLLETCGTLEDPQYFHDPWNHENITKFLHILTFFSLNFKCFAAFMTNELQTVEEQNSPLNLAELFSKIVNSESEYHYLSLLSLNAVVWNLNISIFLMELLDFQNILLELQKSIDIVNAEDEITTENIVDAYILLRHNILLSSYLVKSIDDESNTEEYYLPELPPPKPNTEGCFTEVLYDTELSNFLHDNKPGILDANWVTQAREAYKASRDPVQSTTMIQLLDQMQKAIPTADWAENFQWPENITYNTDFWFSEEIHGINLALYYAEQNQVMENTPEARQNLQLFINACYSFIQYERPKKFDGFDWFLSTVFVICRGDINMCKTFISQLIRFPCTIFLWPMLGKVVDKTNSEECTTQFTFMQILESIISNELPNAKFALQNACGMCWSTICNAMVLQCFWGILPWAQVMHFFVISILYSPDYIIYYCASLLHHCQNLLIRNVNDGKLWPEYMNLNDYQCHNYIKYMDDLGKRYGNKILPKMAVKGLDSTNET